MHKDMGGGLHLVGTAHVSYASLIEVRQAILSGRPELVGIELCPGRLEALLDRNRWERMSIVDVLRSGKGFLLLAQIYLETRRGLELANQGGARAKVKDIEMIDLSTRGGPDGGFVAAATWNVGGSVGHWGHVHERRNQYRAELTIAPIDGVWKLTGLEILEEQRL